MNRLRGTVLATYILVLCVDENFRGISSSTMHNPLYLCLSQLSALPRAGANAKLSAPGSWASILHVCRADLLTDIHSSYLVAIKLQLNRLPKVMGKHNLLDFPCP